MTQFFAVETVAILAQGSNGYRHIFLACASKAAAEYHIELFEKPRGFDCRVLEVTEAEHNEILAGKRNGFLPTSKLA